ncbi:hypothetical protein R6Q59_008698 [Mikania micrantha]
MDMTKISVWYTFQVDSRTLTHFDNRFNGVDRIWLSLIETQGCELSTEHIPASPDLFQNSLTTNPSSQDA